MRIESIFSLGAAIGILTGCGAQAELPPLFPVRGQVRLRGKPLAEALVTLHARKADVKHSQTSIGYSDSEGKSAVSTYAASDGAPAGEYAITVELRAPRTVGEEVIRDGRNLLPARYAIPGASQISATVTEGENELPTIDLASR